MNNAQAEEEVEKILKCVDKNNSGTIDYTGFSIRFIIKFFNFVKNSLLQRSTKRICYRKKDLKLLLRCLIKFFTFCKLNKSMGIL